jgi:hypothetical protein
VAPEALPAALLASTAGKRSAESSSECRMLEPTDQTKIKIKSNQNQIKSN